MKKISEHISYKEATYSNTANRLGIENEPNDKQLKCMETVAEKVFLIFFLMICFSLIKCCCF